MRSIRTVAIASILLSLLATLLVYRYIANTEYRVVSQLQPTKVLIATQDIQPGTASSDLEELTKEIVVPRRSFPVGALQRASEITSDKVTLVRVLAGSYIYKEQLGDASRLVGGLVVPIGKVILTLELTGPEHLGKFVQPGTTVAIYNTVKGVSNLIVPEAEVLAIGDQTGPDVSTSEKASIAFSVDPAQAKQLLEAQQIGKIQLALTGPGANSQKSGSN